MSKIMLSSVLHKYGCQDLAHKKNGKTTQKVGNNSQKKSLLILNKKNSLKIGFI